MEAVGRDAGDDERGPALAHCGEAVALQLRRLEIREEDVGVVEEGVEESTAGPGLDIEAKTAFVGVVVEEERGGLAVRDGVGEGAAAPCGVAAGRLDFDYVGTKVAEDPAREGAGHEVGEFDDTDAVEDARFLGGDRQGACSSHSVGRSVLYQRGASLVEKLRVVCRAGMPRCCAWTVRRSEPKLAVP